MDLLEIILTVVIGYFIIYFLWWFYVRQFVLLSDCRSGTLPLTISPDKLKGNLHTNSYAYSVWFFVSDWSHRLTQQKILLMRRSPNGSVNPKIYFDPYENNINVAINTYSLPNASTTASTTTTAASTAASAASAAAALASALAGVTGPAGATGPTGATGPAGIEGYRPIESTFNSDYGTTASHTAAAIADAASVRAASVDAYLSTLADYNYANFDSSNTYQGLSDDTGTAGSTTATGSAGRSSNSAYICKINNFPLQRWVSLVVSLNNRTLDLYLNGKLVRTCILPATAVIDSTASVSLTPDGGFKGWTSNTQYFSKALNPHEVYNIYAVGPKCGGRLSLFDRYKLKLTYLVNNQETGSVTI
jgi:hypothetical protein